MSVSTETLPTSHASRQSLIDEIEAISTRARAEANFSVVALSDEKNPWEGAGAALAIAREQLAAFDEQSRLANSRESSQIIASGTRICERHELRHCASLRSKPNRSSCIKANRELLGNPYFAPTINVGAIYRNGPPTSPLDAKEREIATAWKALEDERARLRLRSRPQRRKLRISSSRILTS